MSPSPTLPLSLPRPLAKTLKALAYFGPELLQGVPSLRGPASTSTTRPQTLSPAPQPPRAKPHREATPPTRQEPQIEPWTEADITPDPAEPARPEKPKGGEKGRLFGAYKSRAQWRKFWADPSLRKYARRKAHRTKGGPITRYRKLIERKGSL